METPSVFDDRIVSARRPTAVVRRAASQSAWRSLTLGLILVDSLLVNAAFFAAYVIRFNTGWGIFVQDAFADLLFYERLVIFGVTPSWLLIFAVIGLYRRDNLLGGAREYDLVVRGTVFGLLPLVFLSFLVPSFVIARGWLVIGWTLALVFVGVGRFFMRRLAYAARRRGYFLTQAVIVGANQEGRWLAEQFLNSSTSGFQLIGFVDEKVPAGTLLFHNLPSLGSSEHLDRIIKKYDIREIVLATSAYSSRDNMLEIFKRYANSGEVNLRLSSGLYEIITTGLQVQEFGYVPLVNVSKVRLTGIDQVFKMALDYCLTIPGLLLISPLMLALALLVRFDSPGPILHRRRVMGLNGIQFDAFKFRTMYINGDEILNRHAELKAELQRNHKLKDDPRITRIGRFLRKYSLDELPQLFNVLRAEMSLVGPRMISPAELAQYNQWGINLLTVRPGLTGLWQVSGRSDVGYDERVRLDMYYIRNWSIWADLQILFQTLPAVLKGRGAY
jgi:exopolysaccharide biosynthesis polyprenyl glycosylphosphotransferase